MNEPKLPQLQPDIGVTRLDPIEAPDFTVYEQSEAKVSVKRATAYGQQCYAAGVAAERERCAKLCEDMSAYTGGHGEPSAPTGDRYAAAIRKGETP